MAIDERNVAAGVVNPESEEVQANAATQADRGNLGLDDLRLRLDSPLFARDPGLAAPAQVPRLRELTWEHVVNPTSQHPVVPADEPGARPAPVKIEDLLASPADPFGGQAAAAPATVTPDAEPAEVAPPATVETDPAPSRRSAVAPALPSFASMISSEVPQSSVPEPRDLAISDELVKPIEEPPPVARDTDPVVAGLAELIVRATPVTGMPRVEAVRDALRGDTGTLPVIVPADDVPPAAPAVAGFAPPTPAAGVGATTIAADPVPTPPPAPVRPVTGVQPAVPLSAVEAELNRLAYLPDQEEDLGPVEVPEIAYSDVRSAEPAVVAPVLSQAELYTPRQSAAPVRHAYNDLVEKALPAPRRRKRHIGRRVLSTVVLLAMVGGGLFAVKYFVLDQVKWADDVAPLAKDVETTRGLKFDHDVAVVTLPSGEYATELVESTHGITETTRTTTATTWRALGLLSGPLDEGAIGLAAMADSPAFYDPVNETIFVVDGLQPELKTFAMHRALTMALLDQRFGWGDRVAAAAPAVAVGTRAFYDADAMAVALTMLTDDDRSAVIAQLFALYADYDIPASPSPFASTTSGRLGVALWPYFDAQGAPQRDLLEADAAVTDGQVLDLRRLTSGQPESAGSQAQGMLFWYHVLAARLDDDLAWNAALGWRGDSLVADATGTSSCVTGTVRVADSAAQVAVAAFTAWAASAPPESATQVSSVPGQAGAATQITVSACDPGATVVTNDGGPRLSLGGAPLRVQQYRTLLDTQSTLTPKQAACAVYGSDGVGIADERGLVDPVDGWPAPSAHPMPDPAAAGCLTPTP